MPRRSFHGDLAGGGSPSASSTVRRRPLFNSGTIAYSGLMLASTSSRVATDAASSADQKRRHLVRVDDRRYAARHNDYRRAFHWLDRNFDFDFEVRTTSQPARLLSSAAWMTAPSRMHWPNLLPGSPYQPRSGSRQG